MKRLCCFYGGKKIQLQFAGACFFLFFFKNLFDVDLGGEERERGGVFFVQ